MHGGPLRRVPRDLVYVFTNLGLVLRLGDLAGRLLLSRQGELDATV